MVRAHRRLHHFQSIFPTDPFGGNCLLPVQSLRLSILYGLPNYQTSTSISWGTRGLKLLLSWPEKMSEFRKITQSQIYLQRNFITRTWTIENKYRNTEQKTKWLMFLHASSTLIHILCTYASGAYSRSPGGYRSGAPIFMWTKSGRGPRMHKNPI